MLTTACVLLVAIAAAPEAATPQAAEPGAARPRPPNVVLVVADDLGYGELGCYGQTRIRTPHLDALAREGLRFTQAYAGAPVCAPSRCALLTGRDPEHMAIRDNVELAAADGTPAEGQAPLPKAVPTIASTLRARGYATALVGKWGLGGPGSGSEPRDHGFQSFLGYLCQRHAHDHAPTYLWRDDRRVDLTAGTYAQDRFVERALGFLDEPRDTPFLLVFAPALPHLALQAPEEETRAYDFPEKPYDGSKGYRAHERPRAAYAAMVSRVDRDVGRIVAKLRERGIERDTLVLVTSDNGPTHDVGGADTTFFESSGGLRGRKGSVSEGGLRVPFLAWRPGSVPSGAVSDLPIAAWDVLATIAAVAGVASPATEGESFADVLAGSARAERRARIAWAFPGYGGQIAVRDGRWKAYQQRLANGGSPVRVHDLAADPREERVLTLEALPEDVRARIRADLDRLRPLATPR